MAKKRQESIFDKVARNANIDNINLRTTRATRWLSKNVRSLRSVNPNSIMNDEKRSRSGAGVGDMYFFGYDAKTKADLPYWDKFPLSIIVDFQKDGFTGLNLHYLFPTVRARFLGKLMDFTNNKKYDSSTEFKLKYELLKGVSTLQEFQPCFKKYLINHVTSQKFLKVPANEWEIAIFLPVERFQKESKEHVWRQSRKKYK